MLSFLNFTNQKNKERRHPFMWLHKATIRNVDRALKEVNAFELEGDYRPATKMALKEILEGRMANGVDAYLGRSWYERRDQNEVDDYRNGSYVRHLLTELGDIELKIPRTRRGFRSLVLEAYKRRPKHVDRLIMSCFVLGMSTRKVALALLPILGEKISPQLVSDVAKMLDGEVKRYHKRELEDRYRFLYFDGIVLKHKGAAKVQKRIILCAYGITYDKRKEMIDFILASSESQNGWEGFLRNLYERGLRGESTELIITDGGKGLLAALEVIYPKIEHQHCWAHKSRNVLDKVSKRDREKVKRDLNKISHAINRKEAVAAYWKFCAKYRNIYPKAVASLEKNIDELLTFYQVKLLPQEKRTRSPDQIKIAQQALWRKIRTTNLIERSFVEVRRRTRPMGVFGNRTSMDRILFAVFYHLNHKDQEEKSLFVFTRRS
jgi:transposase-like protein